MLLFHVSANYESVAPISPYLRDAPQAVRVLTRRVDLLAEALDLDRARVRDWTMAQAVLSAWWVIEDNGDNWEEQIACAELLAAIKR